MVDTRPRRLALWDPQPVVQRSPRLAPPRCALQCLDIQATRGPPTEQNIVNADAFSKSAIVRTMVTKRKVQQACVRATLRPALCLFTGLPWHEAGKHTRKQKSRRRREISISKHDKPRRTTAGRRCETLADWNSWRLESHEQPKPGPLQINKSPQCPGPTRG